MTTKDRLKNDVYWIFSKTGIEHEIYKAVIKKKDYTLNHFKRDFVNFVTMTEQQIQSKRIKQLECEGYYVIKLIKTNKNGIPDLIAIPPDCGVIFSEVKTSKGKLSKLQEYRLQELEAHGVTTEVYRG